MEKRGIRTERGDLNCEIKVTNKRLRQLKARISKLQGWLKAESETTEPPTLADYIQGKLKPIERRLGTLKKHIKQSDIYFKYKEKKKRKSKKSVYSILRQEQREQQPRRKQDMER